MIALLVLSSQIKEKTKMYGFIIAVALLIDNEKINKEPVKKWPEWECVRWSWTGDVYERRVICLEWRKRENRWIP